MGRTMSSNTVQRFPHVTQIPWAPHGTSRSSHMGLVCVGIVGRPMGHLRAKGPPMRGVGCVGRTLGRPMSMWGGPWDASGDAHQTPLSCVAAGEKTTVAAQAFSYRCVCASGSWGGVGRPTRPMSHSSHGTPMERTMWTPNTANGQTSKRSAPKLRRMHSSTRRCHSIYR